MPEKEEQSPKEIVLRQPIVTVLGHVDHGKTTLLDKIRQTSLAEKEPGQITQNIGASQIPTNVVEKICKACLVKFKFQITIPGLLFIDTPGHEAFTTLRKRGGSIADLAILVVDIMEGLKPQTIESLEILKAEKTPFVIAVNKIDRIPGWKTPTPEQLERKKIAATGKVPEGRKYKEAIMFVESFGHQSVITQRKFEEQFYKIIEQISKRGFSADRFDRIASFKSTIAAVPVSGKTGEGVPELLAILIGLAQQFLTKQLVLTNETKGSVLEVKDVVGLGKTLDVIIYDGTIRRGEFMVIGGKNPMITRIKCLLEPEPLKDTRAEKKFKPVDECTAACGVRVAAPGIENVISGSPIVVVNRESDAKRIFIEFEHEKEKVEIVREDEGLVLKADSVGSLEAMLNIFRDYPIKEATIGNITKEAVIHAETNKEPTNMAVIGFNVGVAEDAATMAKDKGIKILSSNIVYHLVEDYEKWSKDISEKLKQNEIDVLTRPGKISIMTGYVFRASNPAIVGCDVFGFLKPGYKLFKWDKQLGVREVGEIKQLQKEGTNVDSAKTGDKLAVSITGPTVGRQVVEGDVLYTNIGSEEFKRLRQFEKFLSNSEKEVLKEIFDLKRKSNPRYGI